MCNHHPDRSTRTLASKSVIPGDRRNAAHRGSVVRPKLQDRRRKGLSHFGGDGPRLLKLLGRHDGIKLSFGGAVKERVHGSGRCGGSSRDSLQSEA